MKDFKVIMTNDRNDFELKIKNNLQNGYKMINSNGIVTYNPIQVGTYLAKKELYFYAYMEKETEE